MDAVNKMSRTIIIQYLLFIATILALMSVVATTEINNIIGNSGSGYSAGVAIDFYRLLLIGIKLLVSISIAYLIGPAVAESLKKGKNALIIGMVSLVICWTTPSIILSTIDLGSDLTLQRIIIISLSSIFPSLLFGPVAGLKLEKINK